MVNLSNEKKSNSSIISNTESPDKSSSKVLDNSKEKGVEQTSNIQNKLTPSTTSINNCNENKPSKDM